MVHPDWAKDCSSESLRLADLINAKKLKNTVLCTNANYDTYIKNSKNHKGDINYYPSAHRLSSMCW